jgi:hypothetical protein
LDWTNKRTTSYTWVSVDDPKIIYELILPQKSRRITWQGMWHILEAGEMHSGFCWGIGKLGHRWEYNIKVNLQDVEWVGMDWIALAQDRDRWRALMKAVMNLRFPSTARIFLTG